MYWIHVALIACMPVLLLEHCCSGLLTRVSVCLVEMQQSVSAPQPPPVPRPRRKPLLLLTTCEPPRALYFGRPAQHRPPMQHPLHTRRQGVQDAPRHPQRGLPHEAPLDIPPTGFGFFLCEVWLSVFFLRHAVRSAYEYTVCFCMTCTL